MGALMEWISSMFPMLLQAVIGGAVAGVVFGATVRVELKYLRRDVDHAHRRLDQITGIG
jgi:hypothetical protein